MSKEDFTVQMWEASSYYWNSKGEWQESRWDL